jgi:hypothetical protein
MVDLSARTRSVRRASRSQISQRSRKDRPHHGVDVLRIEPWPPQAVPFGIAVRPGAPGASVRCRRRQPGSIAWAPMSPELVRDAPARSRGRSTAEPDNRDTAAQASGSRVPSMAARATSVRRRLLLRA